ncbi:MAG TPA: AGE family epimerase/isomerase, partial [Thermoguttaceae bacterium]|nr:AGE family epimerase/isomerase [Thermoguttaceae bacterium]
MERLLKTSTRRDWMKTVGLETVGLPLGLGLLRSARASETQQDQQEDQGQDVSAREIEHVLFKGILDAWYPRCLDRAGGFHENFAEDWSRRPTESKFIVFQARMTWVPAVIARRYPRQRKRFLAYTRHGLTFLTDRMWDATHGGFIERVDEKGRPDSRWLPWKQLYGQAFGIYGAAGAFQATGDKEALQLAIDGFRWLEDHAHDDKHGGYFECTTAEGRPIALMPQSEWQQPRFSFIGRAGHKSMNAHIHVLEALTALRQVCNDPRLNQRLDEVFLIVRDKIVRPGGHLAMFSALDFTPTDERSSFGHELETAYLLLEAAELVGRNDEKTRRVARELVEHSLRFGWDEKHGGFFDEGPPQTEPVERRKVWWAQPEGINGLLAVDRLPGKIDPRYRATFERNWAFFRDH